LCAECIQPYGSLVEPHGLPAAGYCSTCRKYLQVTAIRAIRSRPARQPKRPRLIWRRQPDETGLRGVCQSPRGKELRHAGVTLGMATGLGSWGSHKSDGYYWYGGWEEYGVPRVNTASRPVPFASLEEACSDMLKHFQEHIDAHLRAQEKQS